MKKVRPGDPLNIPAAAYNAFIDAAEAEKMRRLNGGTGASTAKSTPTIHIQNSSGTDLDAFGVLGIEGPLILPSENPNQFKFNLALDGTTPTTADHLGKFAVLSEPIADGKIGRAYVSGVFPALVTIDDEDHTRADVDDGETTALISSNSGAALILWKAGATSAGGPRWCVVRIDGTGGSGATLENIQLTTGPEVLGIGFHYGKLFSGMTTINAADDATAVMLGTLGGSPDCIVLNLLDVDNDETTLAGTEIVRASSAGVDASDGEDTFPLYIIERIIGDCA